MGENVAMFAVTLLHSATNAHLFHWSTDSYAKHKALRQYYDGIVPLVDDYVEAFSGAYEQIKTFPSVYHQPKDSIKYLQSLQTFVKEARKDLPKDEQLCNLVDAIADLIDSTTYKLRFLR
jgi:hypothetical protein